MNRYAKFGISLLGIVIILICFFILENHTPNHSYANSKLGYELTIPEGWSIVPEYSACMDAIFHTNSGIAAPCQSWVETERILSDWDQNTSEWIVLSNASKAERQSFLQEVKARKTITLDYPYPSIFVGLDTVHSTTGKGEKMVTKGGYHAALLTADVEGVGYQSTVLIENPLKPEARIEISYFSKASTTDDIMRIADSIRFK